MQRSKHLFTEIVAELRKDPPPYPPTKKKQAKARKKKKNVTPKIEIRLPA